jgi:hypothetical protein
MAKEDMDKYLKYLKEKKKVEDLLRGYGLSYTLAKSLILCYEFKVSPKSIAQKFGTHLSTIKRYYEQFGQMLESDFELIFNFYYSQKLKQEVEESG